MRNSKLRANCVIIATGLSGTCSLSLEDGEVNRGEVEGAPFEKVLVEQH